MASTPEKRVTRKREPVDYDDKKHLLSSPVKSRDDMSATTRGGGITELEEQIIDKADRWETDSMFEDIIEDLTEDKFFTDGKCLELCIATPRSLLSWGARRVLTLVLRPAVCLDAHNCPELPLFSPTCLSLHITYISILMQLYTTHYMCNHH
jgi:hypothetical protein